MSRAAMILGAATALAAGQSQAQPAPESTTTYYAGEARVTNLLTGGVETEQVLLLRRLEPAANRIVEVACVKHGDRPAIVSPAYIGVSGSRLTVADNTAGTGGAVSGEGEALGPAWAWRRLRLSMTYTSPRGSVRIQDDNYLVGDRLIARKAISLADGTPVQLWEIEMSPVAPSDIDARRTALGCGPLTG